MAMGTRSPGQVSMFLTGDQLPQAPTAPFFVKLNQLLEQMGFDRVVQALCRPFYADRLGRRSHAVIQLPALPVYDPLTLPD